MHADLLTKYDRPVPRYTSYPTAPHFSESIGNEQYADWLGELPADLPLSAYVHIPFCDSLCWFCGCNMRVVNRYSSIRTYLGHLNDEIDAVAAAMGHRPSVKYLHFGGGSPDILRRDDIISLLHHLRDVLPFARDLEFAVEIDPRAADISVIEGWAAAGATRASIGVQDFDPKVQKAINREQSFDCTANAVRSLRAAGVGRINIDVMYGLPHQTVEGVRRTTSQVVEIAPDRLALFGYAHVPWMKPHQRLIPEDALAGGAERWAQFEAAAGILRQAGYVWIGLDHFARPDDPLALAQSSGRLRRNFQGYTTDEAEALVGLGASAISALPQGYVQNATEFKDYAAATRSGGLAAARGIALTPDDCRRRSIIERLMCDLRVDVRDLVNHADNSKCGFDREFERLSEMAADGLVELGEASIKITERGRPFMRSICAVFDRYIDSGVARHSRPV